MYIETHKDEFRSMQHGLLVKAHIRAGMASQAMELWDEAVSWYIRCLKLNPSPDAATCRDIEERIKAAKQAKQATAARAARFASAGAGTGSGSAAGTGTQGKDMRALMMESGSLQLSVYGQRRSFPGGPRDPAVVIAAFTPLMSTDWIRLEARPGRGVGVFAARRIPTGTTVHVEVPLLAVVPPLPGAKLQLKKGNCYHCLLPVATAAAVACNAPCDRIYCSMACKNEALERYHGPLCSLADGKAVAKLEEYTSTGSTASSKFILCIWKMIGFALVAAQKAGGSGLALQPPADVPPFCHLPRVNDVEPEEPATLASASAVAEKSELDEMSEMICPAMNFLQMHVNLLPLLGSALAASPALSAGALLDAWTLVSPNAMGVIGAGRDGFAARGQVIMGAGNCFNHSCEPNTHEVTGMDTAGSKIAFVTDQPIAAGEELTIAYTDHTAPYQTRLLQLRAQYGFACKRPKCLRQGGKAKPATVTDASGSAGGKGAGGKKGKGKR
jgi:hypothetical protein